jgi:hypothetical protein
LQLQGRGRHGVHLDGCRGCHVDMHRERKARQMGQ